MKNITIIGAGPSGLFCAYELLKAGYKVDLYDKNPAAGRKFLIAGKGGLNITHSENLEELAQKYGEHEETFQSLLKDFSNTDLQNWCGELGVKTFIGSTGRIFPTKFNAAEFLIEWLKKLKSFNNFSFYPNHELVNLSPDQEVQFLIDNNQEIAINPEILILCLGGASWQKTGSNGKWKDILSSLKIEIKEFTPMNCGFKCKWSEHFLKKELRLPIKNISLSFKDMTVKGELMTTSEGIEGGAIYAISNYLRNEINKNSIALVSIDLKPDLTKEDIIKKIHLKNNKETFKNFLRKKIKLDEASYQLLLELSDSTQYTEPLYLAQNIKGLKVRFFSPCDINKAISTGGGVDFKSLNKKLESLEYKDLYFCGEMLDFEARTGGYLLQGCFSTAARVVKSILNKS